MSEIGLTPQGHPQWRTADSDPEPARLKALREAFGRDWREGLFSLGAEKIDAGESLSLPFWKGIAEHFLTRLCHLPEKHAPANLEPPTEAECGQWILTAPPMRGGEYLTAEALLGIWQEMTEWADEAARAAGGLSAFLEERAPRWRQVGRVCFHLAENKNDPKRPFAFMATYIAGLGAGNQPRHRPLRQALEAYAGAKNRTALIKLLAPVEAAAERVDWVRAMVDSGEVYRPLAWPPERAHRFLLDAPVLEESGLAVRLPDWWRRRPRPRVAVTIGESKTAALGADALLDFDAKVALGDATLSRKEVEDLLSGGDGLVMVKGQWIEVDSEKLREAIAQWEAVRAHAGKDGISFIEGMRMLAGASGDLRHEEALEQTRQWAHVEAGEALRGVLERLRDPAQLEPGGNGAGLRAELRPYQREGVTWLRFLAELGLGACLADDMGLGKTIQVLALLLHQKQNAEKKAGAPSLLVVPASLLGNWRAEADRFAPSLWLCFLHPAETDRAELKRIESDPSGHLADCDLVITTYAMLTRQPWLAEVDWRLVILDEAQAIKNPSTRQSRAVRKLPARARIALTGTPVENRLGDLWSLFDFLNPGLLGSSKVFDDFVKKLEKRPSEQFAPLRRLVSPYILRRMKTDRSIIADLPEKVEMTRYCTLTKVQARLYQQIVSSMKQSLERMDGIKRRGLILQTLMRLKQVCNHPSQLTGEGDYATDASGKFQRLAEICEELAERQQRVLVFTQFREIIDPLTAHLAGVFGRPGIVLHGATGVGKRKTLVEQFQREDGPPFFILSLKAGGSGLNLTAASHVVHFDRWWNPAVEDQATDRAFRIGQQRNVMVHKFVTSGSVEDRIDRMITEKRQLAREVLSGSCEVDLTSLGDDELIELVRLDVNRATA